MPLFEFVCTKCEEQFELLVPSNKWEGKAACPHCGSKKLTKELSVFASSVPASDGGCFAPAPCPLKPGGKGPGCGCCGPKHRH